MNWEQIKGVAERLVTIGVGWAIGKGYVPPSIGPELIIVVLGALSVAWGWWVNTPTALASATRKVGG